MKLRCGVYYYDVGNVMVFYFVGQQIMGFELRNKLPEFLKYQIIIISFLMILPVLSSKAVAL